MVTKYNLSDRFGLKLGARYEQVETKAKLSGLITPDSPNDSANIITKIFDMAISDSPFDNPYTKVYLSAFLLYKFTEKQKHAIWLFKKS